MQHKHDTILLGHGSGGKLTHDLIKDLFIKHFSNPALNQQTDSAIVSVGKENLAFTTDSFVVDPLFFPGGDIGKLAVCGTINDLAVSGAKPLFLSCSFIIEEGFSLSDLEKITISMSEESRLAGVELVTGDTKVVDRGKCDKIFITTTGIGQLDNKYMDISYGKNIRAGDKIIINGSVGDHGMAVMSARNELKLRSSIRSDCAPLNDLIEGILEMTDQVRFMRDATRGGLGTVLAELSSGKGFGIMVNEEDIPVNEPVRGVCEILGFDPLYVANEGKVVLVVGKKDAEKVLAYMKMHDYGMESAIIGEIVEDHTGRSWLSTSIGGKRIIDMLAGEQLPRIC